MGRHSSFLRGVAIAFLFLSLPACTELGDLVIIRYQVAKNPLTLRDLDGSYLPKKKWGDSPKCLTRRSEVGLRQYTGICIDEKQNEILIYRAFKVNFDIDEKGISQEVRESEGYKELLSIASGLEKLLRAKGIKFRKSEPHYEDFRLIHERYQFTR